MPTCPPDSVRMRAMHGLAATVRASSRLPPSTRNWTRTCFQILELARMMSRRAKVIRVSRSCERVAAKQYASGDHGTHALAAGAAFEFARSQLRIVHGEAC